MTEIFNLFVLSLVCWRISYMLVFETGPLGIFDYMRKKTAQSRIFPFKCFYCTTVWVAFPLAMITGSLTVFFLAISTVAIFLHLFYDRLEK